MRTGDLVDQIAQQNSDLKNDQKLYAFVLAQFDAAVMMLSGKPADVAFGLINKTQATADLALSRGQSRGVEISSSAAQIILTTANLLTLGAKAHPAVAVSTIGATFMKKTALAFGMANNNEQAKCISIYSDMAAAGLQGVTGIALMLTGGGMLIGGATLASGLAQILLAASNAQDNACLP
ncbi:MAG: hypothetical protein AAF515_01515 [Pseudomonadota bacterium]